MGKFAIALPQPISQWWNWLWVRCYFKFVLPKIEIAELDGIRLDLKAFSLKVRNRILHGYEEPEKKICREFLTTEDSVLEIGGGIGFIGLFCQKQLGITKYLTIEANPDTIEILKRNYRLNHLNPLVWNFAITDNSGTVNLNVTGDFWSHFVTSSRQKNVERLTVPCITISDLLERAGAGFNVLIIDIEGAERFIDFPVLPEGINKIIMEIHPHLIGKRAASTIIDDLTQMGFEVVYEETNTFALLKNG